MLLEHRTRGNSRKNRGTKAVSRNFLSGCFRTEQLHVKCFPSDICPLLSRLVLVGQVYG